MLRRPLVLAAALTLAALGLHPVSADQAPSTGATPGALFNDFSVVDGIAQGQLFTGYLFAVGDEEDRLVGAATEINGPPPGAQAVAAFFQQGKGATYIYGVLGGGGNGKSGALPQPPPGEADAFFPANPQEGRWEGPITTAAKDQAADGRFHSKVDDTPTARADAQVTRFEVPGAVLVEQAVVDSHGEPANGGVDSESISVLRGITIGPLHIDQMVSRAYGFIPSGPGAPKGIASTIVLGATVNGTPVQITDKGLVVDKNAAPGAQDQVNDALTKAGFPAVKLTPSLVTSGPDQQSVHATTGELHVTHRDDSFAAKNPQGFAGGGFAIGGAEVQLQAGKCAGTCPGGTGSDLNAPPVGVGGAPVSSEPSASTGTSASTGGSSSPSSSSSSSSSSSYLPSTSSSGSATIPPPPSSEPSGGSSATTPSAPTAVPRTSGAGAAQARAALAGSLLGTDDARWMRDAYLVGATALLVLLLVGGRLVRVR